MDKTGLNQSALSIMRQSWAVKVHGLLHYVRNDDQVSRLKAQVYTSPSLRIIDSLALTIMASITGQSRAVCLGHGGKLFFK